MEISETNCPVALVPAPPAVNPITPDEVIVPAKEPATPPAVVVVFPSMGRVGVTPAVTVVAAGVASPSRNVSVKVNGDPAVVML